MKPVVLLRVPDGDWPRCRVWLAGHRTHHYEPGIMLVAAGILARSRRLALTGLLLITHDRHDLVANAKELKWPRGPR